MRIRLPLGRSLFFVCALLFSLVALFPLRVAVDWLALGDRGFAAREARGSIWLGALSEAQFGPIALGDLRAGLRTLPLVLGRARVDLERAEDEDPFRSGLTVSRHSFGIDDMTARLDIGSALAPLPVTSLDLTDVSARFADGICASAEGSVKAEVRQAGGLGLAGGFTGNARCQEGALLLPLVSQTGMEALNLRLFENGSYEVELAMRPIDPTAARALLLAGFSAAPNGAYTLRSRGKF